MLLMDRVRGLSVECKKWRQTLKVVPHAVLGLRAKVSWCRV